MESKINNIKKSHRIISRLNFLEKLSLLLSAVYFISSFYLLYMGEYYGFICIITTALFLLIRETLYLRRFQFSLDSLSIKNNQLNLVLYKWGNNEIKCSCEISKTKIKVCLTKDRYPQIFMDIIIGDTSAYILYSDSYWNQDQIWKLLKLIHPEILIEFETGDFFKDKVKSFEE